MEHFFELLKYTVPSLIVFATAYLLLKKYLDAQYQLTYLETINKNGQNIIPIKLQAYERLLLFCERMKISNTVNRLRSNEMTVKDLKTSMLISIQKEYEHNLAQKLYVSSKLWEIIELTKNETLNIMSNSGDKFDPNDNADQYAKSLIILEQSQNKTTADLAIQAIKEEAKIYLETA